MTVVDTDLSRLEKHIDQRFDDAKDVQSARFEVVETKIESVKTDARTRFPTREEFTTIIEKIQDSIKSINISNAKIDGKADQSSVGVLRFFAIAGLFVGLVGLLMSCMALAVTIWKTFGSIIGN